jgi:endonuclease-3 related protein
MHLNPTSRLVALYDALRDHFPHEPHWWPMHGNDRTFEVMVGMVLVQQTQWGTVEAAVLRMLSAGITSFDVLSQTDPHHLAQLCKPCAFYGRKAAALIRIAQHVCTTPGGSAALITGDRTSLRQTLLSLPQIGRESADTVLLYAGQHPLFIVDAYARRVLARTGVYADLIDCLRAPYDEVQRVIEADVGPLDVETARELHAMMVEASIHHCTANNPRCTRSGAMRRFVDPRKCQHHCPPCGGCPAAALCQHHLLIG